MKFILEIDLENAAFTDNEGESGYAEVARILRYVADRVEVNDRPYQEDCGTAKDINGNSVCKWEVVD